MSSVDNRIINMSFNNSAFERGVNATLSTLAKLKASLTFSKEKTNLSDLESSADKFNMGKMATAIEGVSKKFTALSAVGITALATLTTKAVDAGLAFVKSFTLAPIKAGFDNYETQINAIQTILANTGLKGADGLKQVNATLDELNTYANKTVYNFSEMAKNIGTFTAAGVKLKPAAQSIKGIANLAALSGSNSNQASMAMYQLSQAIAAGQVHLQDWNSVVNAGMGGKVFQQALFETGKALHTITDVKAGETFDQWTKAGNSFRQSLESGWVTGKVLTQTLEGFTGDLTKAQLKSMGYNAAQIKQIQEMGKTAVDAATKIKTVTQLKDALKEEVATAYATVFKTIFGDINQAKKTLSALHTVVENALTGPIYALNKLLEGWSKLGGRTVLIDGLKKAFQALFAVVKPIKDAFREIFPPETSKELYDLTVRFRDFMKNLKIGDDTANNLKRTFAGFFAALDIGKQIISGVFHVLTTLLGSIFKGSGAVLEFTGNIGDFIVKIDQMLRNGTALPNFFEIVADDATIVVGAIKSVISAITHLFTGVKPHSSLKNALGDIGNELSNVQVVGGKVAKFFQSLWNDIQPVVTHIIDAFGTIGQAIANVFTGTNVNNILHLLNTGLLAGIAVMIKKFFSKGLSVDIGGGAFDSIKEAFEGLTGQMKAMQQEVKANTLLKIAGAIGIITASVVALSFIDAKKLQTSMTALGVGFAELLGAMKILTSISGSAGFLKVPVIAASMDLLAGSILILTAAVYALSKLSWKQLQKGLTAVGILLAEISAATIPLSRNSAGLIRAGIGITAIGVAMNILYLAVKNFSKLSWGELLKGLTAVGSLLIGIAGAMRLMPTGMVAMGAGLLEISAALLIMYKAVSSFAKLSWSEMLKGLTGLAGSLVGIAIAMRLMPKGILLQAAALVVLGAALNIIGKALASMGGMSWEQIVKGLVALGGAMLILVVGLNALDGALPGAAAILIVSGALKVLAEVMKTLGSMSWGDLIKSLVGMAAAFAVIGVAGLLLAPVTPALLALGVAMTLVGAGFALFGAGALAVATAIGILAKMGSAGVKVLLEALEGFIKMLPTLGKNLALMLTNFITTIGKNAPQIVGALVKVLSQLLDAVVKLAPKMVKAIDAVISALLQAIRDNFPKLVKTGLDMLVALLKGIKDHIGNVVKTVADIIVNFLNALAKNIGRIIQAGVNLLVKFLEGIASALGHMPKAVFQIIGAFLKALWDDFGPIVKGGLQLLEKFIGGIVDNVGKLASAAWHVVTSLASELAGLAWRMIKAGAKAIADFISGIVTWVADHVKDLWQAGVDMAKNLVQGLAQGLTDSHSTVDQAINSLSGGMVDGVKSIFGINSPSKVFMGFGRNLGEGLAIGLRSMRDHVAGSAEDVGRHTVLAMSKTISGLSDALNSSDMNLQPTISPVLDLTQVNKDASKLDGLLGSKSVNATVSATQATDISTARQRVIEVQTAEQQTTLPTSITFEQKNYSPKALTSVEIYRQTKNQLALAKKVLGSTP